MRFVFIGGGTLTLLTVRRLVQRGHAVPLSHADQGLSGFLGKGSEQPGAEVANVCAVAYVARRSGAVGCDHPIEHDGTPNQLQHYFRCR